MQDFLALHGPDLIAKYGYLAIGVLVFFEGETIVVLAGLAAHGGYLSIEGVVLAAFTGTFLGDQLYFHLGRHYGRRVLDWRPQWRSAAARAMALLQRYDTAYILAFRFLYGLRTVSPFVIGMGGTATHKYLILNAVAGGVWAIVFSGLGYLFGHAVELVLGDIARYEIYLFALVALVGALALLRAWRRQHGRKGKVG